VGGGRGAGGGTGAGGRLACHGQGLLGKHEGETGEGQGVSVIW